MRVIDKRWIKLKEGYNQLKYLSARFDAEWKRPIQVAQRRKHKQEYAVWKSNRRIFLSVASGVFLVFSLLCGLSFFSEEWGLKCLYSFLTISILLGGIGFGLVSRSFIRSIFARPEIENYFPLSQQLVELWWKSLEPRFQTVQNPGDEGVYGFIDLLADNLPNSYLVVSEILTSKRKITDTDVLLLGPSGIWVFEVKHWYGVIHKKDGEWWQRISNRRIDHLQENGERKQGPDEQWLNQVREITTTIKRRRPDVAWATEHIQGGIVFSNPEARLDLRNIIGSRASYGRPRHWLNRILKAHPDKNFTLEVQLQVLDALIEFGLSIERDKIIPVSANLLAERAYQKASQVRSNFVSEWAK